VRLVLDTNVLVAAMRSRSGASSRLLQAGLIGKVSLLASVPLFIEYEALMTRPEHLAAAKVSSERIGLVLDDLARLIVPVPRDLQWRPQLNDAGDEMALEAAINGQAEAIVTFEIATFRAAALRFGIDVLTPAQACAKVAR